MKIEIDIPELKKNDATDWKIESMMDSIKGVVYAHWPNYKYTISRTGGETQHLPRNQINRPTFGSSHL